MLSDLLLFRFRAFTLQVFSAIDSSTTGTVLVSFAAVFCYISQKFKNRQDPSSFYYFFGIMNIAKKT